uniref:MHC class I-like antigen recognition-like domain-containing protein n=1 Tax=Propithecus coquereli TaxID=379532 RepID=A0A2K6GM22_PROCO
MAPAAGSKLGQTVLRLWLLLLLTLWACAGRAETHCLSYIFTIIIKSTPGQQWCEVQAQMDGKIFLQGNCGNKNFKPCGPLGKEIYGTNDWEEQMEILTNVAEDLRKKLLDIQRENDTPLDNFTVKVRMSCQHEANGHTNGSWQFHFNGQEFLVFGSESRKWTLAHPGARHMKEKWENDMDVTKFFHNILIGDCKTLLTKFLLHWEKLLQPTAPPTEAPGTAQPKARATRSICCSLTLLLPCSILLAVL